MNQQWISATLLAIACSGTQAWAAGPVSPDGAGKGEPDRITVSSTGFAKGAVNHVTSVSAQCPGRQFSLQIDPDHQRVTLHQAESDTATDLSATKFGTTFLTKNLYGKFAFACPSGVMITFFGFEAQRSGPPKAVQYRLTLRENGEVISDSGLLDESYEYLNLHLAKTRN